MLKSVAISSTTACFLAASRDGEPASRLAEGRPDTQGEDREDEDESTGYLGHVEPPTRNEDEAPFSGP